MEKHTPWSEYCIGKYNLIEKNRADTFFMDCGHELEYWYLVMIAEQHANLY